MEKEIKVSDFIANFLAKRNITKCFVVTGGGAMHLNDSFGHHSEIECIYNHHEQACAMGAEGYSRISGEPGIVSVTSGPGSTNAITGVLGAWLDSIPMIIISGQMKFETTIASTSIPLRQLGFQEFNVVDSVKCLTKYAVMISDPNYIAYHLEKAFHLATTGRKGPVWLDIPLDVQAAKIKPSTIRHYDFEYSFNSFTEKEKLNQQTLSLFFDKLNKAKKPIIMAGYGIRMDKCHKEFINLVEKLQIPVVTEWNSHDLIWDEHPLNAGRPGTIGNRGGNFVVQNSDFILALGCQFSIRQISYVWENFAKDAFIMAINPDKDEMLKPIINIDLPIQMNIKRFIENVIESKFNSIHTENLSWKSWCKNINNKYPVFDKKSNSKQSPISVYSFINSLSNNMLPEDIVVLANGAACVCGLQAIKINKFHRVFTNAGASSMGYGIAASVGAAVAISSNKNQQILCIEGDGSIQMNLQELQTIVHNNLKVKIFWINNDGYHSIKQTQKSMFDAENRGYCGSDKDSGISFPKAEKIAFAYGLTYFKIDQNAHLDLILKKVINSEKAVLCEIITDPFEDFQPKLRSKLLEDGTFSTPTLEDMYPFLPRDEMQKNIYKN